MRRQDQDPQFHTTVEALHTKKQLREADRRLRQIIIQRAQEIQKRIDQALQSKKNEFGKSHKKKQTALMDQINSMKLKSQKKIKQRAMEYLKSVQQMEDTYVNQLRSFKEKSMKLIRYYSAATNRRTISIFKDIQMEAMAKELNEVKEQLYRLKCKQGEKDIQSLQDKYEIAFLREKIKRKEVQTEDICVELDRIKQSNTKKIKVYQNKLEEIRQKLLTSSTSLRIQGQFSTQIKNGDGLFAILPIQVILNHRSSTILRLQRRLQQKIEQNVSLKKQLAEVKCKNQILISERQNHLSQIDILRKNQDYEKLMHRTSREKMNKNSDLVLQIAHQLASLEIDMTKDLFQENQ